MILNSQIAVTLLLVVRFATASIEKIGPFTPSTEVSDRGALSNDQRVIEELLKTPTGSAFRFSGEVYSEGGSSRTIATVDVPEGTPEFLAALDLVTGVSVDGRTLVAYVLSDTPAGSTQLQLRYSGNGDFDNPNDCLMGGLPFNERDDSGCFVENGVLSLDADAGEDIVEFNCNYTLLAGNTNERTLEIMSSNADVLMRVGGDPGAAFYNSFQPFYDYYGRADYSDHIVKSALSGDDTNLSKGNMNMASAEYSNAALAQVIKKSTAYLTMSMAVLMEIENAVFECDISCNIGECNEDPNISSLDEAVAYFVGQSNNFNHQLNELRCVDFGTCDGDTPTTGEPQANVKAFQLFGEMQDKLKKAKCDEAREIVPQVARQLWIGFIQGALRYAWITDNTGINPGARATDIAQAEGAVFAAGVLPLIEKCSQTHAKTIYDNMAVSALVGLDFVAVKEAFEACYGYLGITCADIGGVVSSNRREYDQCATIPCGGSFALALDVPEGCVVKEPDENDNSQGSVTRPFFFLFGFLVAGTLVASAIVFGT